MNLYTLYLVLYLRLNLILSLLIKYYYISVAGAARAVGTAMSNNPIQIIVPCHRVIKSDGSFGNYAKGCRKGVKKWLLNHEGIQ